ncbi:MAG: hypothetical protein P1U56_11115 [Saprospiraceae bacterium]|nr:hypothetical protein [Saprospiraceae bacterium]
MKLESKKTLAISGLFILFGAFSRLFTFLPNFSALEALALFGGAYIAIRYIAILIPLVALFVSDLIINNTVARAFFPDHEGLVIFSEYMIWNTIAIVAIVLFGRYFLKKMSFLRGAVGILGATGIFWIISNIGAWLSSGLFPLTFAGMIENFIFALPFLKNSLLGNAVFGAILFGSFELLTRSYPDLVTAKHKA